MNRVLAAIVLIAIAGCSHEDSMSVRPASGKAQLPDQAWVRFGKPGQPQPFARSAERIAAHGSFADLPDRGELLSYDADPANAGQSSMRRDGAYTWRRVELSEEHAFRGVVDGRLRVRTPSGELLDIVYDRHEEHPSGDWTWIGHLSGEPGTQTILTFGANAVFGSVGQAGKRSLRVTTRNDAAWLVETDPTKLTGIASAGVNPRKPDHLATPKIRLQTRMASMSAMDPQSAPAAAVSAAAAGTTIDIVVGYTQGFVNENGGTSAALTRLNYLVAVSNQAFVNSQVSASIRLVHSLQVNYTDTTTNESTLEQLTGYDVGQQQYITPNPAFNALRAAREQYGADLVTLVRGFRDPEQDGCGIAWLIGGGMSGVSPGDGQDYFGYSVVSDGDDLNETDSNTYFCRDESFVHELAHNLGSQHDREAAQGGDGTLDPDDYGVFTYSFGLKTSASAGNFFTIMSYGDEGQTDFRVFSNPRITFCGGRVCGTTQFEDNARSLGMVAPIVATFRETTVPIGGVADDINGDGLADLVWRNYQTGSNTIWSGANSASRLPISNVSVVSWRIVGLGDFNGDGRSDVLWRDTASGANSIWPSGNAAARLPVMKVPSKSWYVAGVGDFNGDGRADILWRNTASGSNSIWLSGNFATLQSVAMVPSAWVPVAVGDFNGDGRSDIVWRHSVTGANTLWWSGNISTSVALARVGDLRWFVVGAGDLDGNGSDDLIWRHSATGANSVWPAANASRGVSFTGVTDQRWQVERIADYNGDGNQDLLWRHATTGSGVIWFSANFATRQAISTVPGPYWQVAP